MEKIRRFLVFSAAFITLFGAFGGLIWNAGQTALGLALARPVPVAAEGPGRTTSSRVLSAGTLSFSLCELTSPDGVVIGTYLETRAEELEQPAGDDDSPVTFVVQPGETAGDIADRLAREGLISDAELFRRYVQYKGLDAGIEAGEFTLRATMTIPQIAQAL
ncbi:MAG: endolytic transglycosylase MltG, partial [Anaerolineae bacterium]